jgi:hypothetical protein
VRNGFFNAGWFSSGDAMPAFFINGGPKTPFLWRIYEWRPSGFRPGVLRFIQPRPFSPATPCAALFGFRQRASL